MEIETGWIDDIFYDFMKDSTYHLEDNLPHLSEVIASEALKLCNEEKEKFVKDLKDINFSMKRGTQYINIDGTVKKWEEKLK